MNRQEIFTASVSYFLAPIRAYLEDDSVSEVMVNRFDQVYIERRGQLYATDARFDSEDALLSAVHNVAQWVGREVNAEHPILDARLPDGSRVHAILPPAARGGTCVNIRKFRQGGFTLDDLVRLNSLTPAAREFLEIAVRLHKNTVVSGGTGTGKTSMLGALSTAIPDEERIIVIEDTSELKLHQPHCVYLEVQRADQYGRGELTIRQLFVASLRMRPDRIVVGEVRGGEALDLVQAMLSGHSGGLSTVHANRPEDALTRLETLSMMSDVQISEHVARTQVASAIHLIVQVARFADDGSRRVVSISEVDGLDDNRRFRLHDLFRFQRHGRDAEGRVRGELAPTGVLPTFAAEPSQQGLDSRIRHSRELWKLPADPGSKGRSG